MTVWVESARPLLGQSWHPLESFRAEGHRWSDNQRGAGRSDGSRDFPAIAVNEKDAWALWSKPASVHSTSAHAWSSMLAMAALIVGPSQRVIETYSPARTASKSAARP